MTGKLIAFEGIDGVGKTTQIRLAADELRRTGYDVITTYEPWTASIDPDDPPGVVACKIAIDRYDHVRKVIVPQINRGGIVLCDRFTMSTLAYQGYAGGVQLSTLHRLNEIAINDLVSVAMHIWFYCDPLVAKRRIDSRPPYVVNGEEVYETLDDEGLAYLRRAHHGYWQMFTIDKCKEPTAMVDANGTVDEVHTAVMATIRHTLAAEPF